MDKKGDGINQGKRTRSRRVKSLMSMGGPSEQFGGFARKAGGPEGKCSAHLLKAVGLKGRKRWNGVEGGTPVSRRGGREETHRGATD